MYRSRASSVATSAVAKHRFAFASRALATQALRCLALLAVEEKQPLSGESRRRKERDAPRRDRPCTRMRGQRPSARASGTLTMQRGPTDSAVSRHGPVPRIARRRWRRGRYRATDSTAKRGRHRGEEAQEAAMQPAEHAKAAMPAAPGHDHSDRSPRSPAKNWLRDIAPRQVSKSPAAADNDARQGAEDDGGEDVDQRRDRNLERRAEPDALPLRADGQNGNRTTERADAPKPIARQRRARCRTRARQRQASANPGGRRPFPVVESERESW